jgi:hypothetical protein
LIRKFDNQDPIFRHEPEEHDQADLAEDGDGLLEVPERKESSRDGQRHSRHDSKRIAETFSVCCELQIDEYGSNKKNAKAKLEELSS